MRDVFPLVAVIAILAGGRGGRNLQRQKGGILSVIIYREGTTPCLCSVTVWQLDFIQTPLSQGHKYVLVMICVSHWVETFFAGEQQS